MGIFQRSPTCTLIQGTKLHTKSGCKITTFFSNAQINLHFFVKNQHFMLFFYHIYYFSNDLSLFSQQHGGVIHWLPTTCIYNAHFKHHTYPKIAFLGHFYKLIYNDFEFFIEEIAVRKFGVTFSLYVFLVLLIFLVSIPSNVSKNSSYNPSHIRHLILSRASRAPARTRIPLAPFTSFLHSFHLLRSLLLPPSFTSFAVFHCIYLRFSG